MPVKPNGMTSASAALRFWERRQEVAANNLANVSTTGFKAERVFARLLDGAHTVLDTRTDMRDGTVKPTDSPLDLSLEGPGFFVVSTPSGERYVRGGSFTMMQGGRIVDQQGNALLTEDGPLVLPKGSTIEIDPQGGVSVDGNRVARLRVETVAPNARLQHEGGNMFVPEAERQSVPVTERRIRQGALEQSNVDTMGAMVDMITVQRAYGAVQKVVTTLDGIRGTIANELGKPV